MTAVTDDEDNEEAAVIVVCTVDARPAAMVTCKVDNIVVETIDDFTDSEFIMEVRNGSVVTCVATNHLRGMKTLKVDICDVKECIGSINDAEEDLYSSLEYYEEEFTEDQYTRDYSNEKEEDYNTDQEHDEEYYEDEKFEKIYKDIERTLAIDNDQMFEEKAQEIKGKVFEEILDDENEDKQDTMSNTTNDIEIVHQNNSKVDKENYHERHFKKYLSANVVAQRENEENKKLEVVMKGENVSVAMMDDSVIQKGEKNSQKWDNFAEERFEDIANSEEINSQQTDDFFGDTFDDLAITFEEDFNEMTETSQERIDFIDYKNIEKKNQNLKTDSSTDIYDHETLFSSSNSSGINVDLLLFIIYFLIVISLFCCCSIAICFYGCKKTNNQPTLSISIN